MSEETSRGRSGANGAAKNGDATRQANGARTRSPHPPEPAHPWHPTQWRDGGEPEETAAKKRKPARKEEQGDAADEKEKDHGDAKDKGEGEEKESDSDEDSDDEKSDVEKSEKDSDDKSDEKSDEKSDKKKKKPMSPQKKRLFIVLAVVGFLVLATAALLYWLHARHYENTDDAFIDANQSQLASQVAGRVDAILVADNQHVDAGQLILTLDPRDYQVKLDQAKAAAGNSAAQAQQARADLQLQRANILQQEAQVHEAEANLEQHMRDLARYKNIDPAAVTRQQIDQANAQVKSDTAKLDAARQAVRGAQAQAVSQQAKIVASDASTTQSRSDVANAELQLSYTHLVAPTAGRITRRTVNLGNYVQPGQALLAVVPDEMWVTANFKETQLTYMRIGQPVEVTVDAWSKDPIKAHVDSIQRGTGAVFSSIPAENATGNYVKVVQRVPVKIVFDGDDWKSLPLAPGMSVSPRVTVR